MQRFGMCAAIGFLGVLANAVSWASESPPEPSSATVTIRAGERAEHPIPRYITGKFCEHLFNNISNGMDAQILRNPTLADWPFWTGSMTPDGVTAFESDAAKIDGQLRQQAARLGWPDDARDAMVRARADALACWWIPEGGREAVATSPDTGPHGGRAQRVEVATAGQGIAQWTWLPLHRVRKYEVEILARSPGIGSLTVGLWPPEADRPGAEAVLGGLSNGWKWLRGTLEVDPQVPAEGAYRFTVAADGPGQFVIARALLRPADHVGGADPDVVRLLKESKLPLLRWPGGNFVSGYHWEDGIGPLDQRPARPNYAWGGVETNFFGTDEFIAFCRAVGCEPMICINAGSGTPEEAARWIEYCNGPADSPQGRKRAAAGHPEPYNVRHWEIGNELWGRWQYHWTTAAGYVDRYHQFAPAMLAADPSITLYACGAPAMWGKAWNDRLIRDTASSLRRITDHPLIGGDVPRVTDPLDVFRDFMAVPDVLAGKWAGLRRDMEAAGIESPRLAVTELQMFAHLGPRGSGEKERLGSDNLVSPGTLAEALYDVLIYHRAIRQAPFVEMVTHSATVNHGGGLRKERERVYAQPCHYAQTAFAEFAGATPVQIECRSPEEQAPMVLPDLKNAAQECRYESLDGLAAVAADGSLLVSLVNRGSAGPLSLAMEIKDFDAAPTAELRTLSADVPWAVNRLESPNAVAPVDSTVAVVEGRLTLDLKPYTVARLRIPTRAR